MSDSFGKTTITSSWAHPRGERPRCRALRFKSSLSSSPSTGQRQAVGFPLRSLALVTRYSLPACLAFYASCAFWRNTGYEGVICDGGREVARGVLQAFHGVSERGKEVVVACARRKMKSTRQMLQKIFHLFCSSYLTKPIVYYILSLIGG